MARLPQVLAQNDRSPICEGDLIILLAAGICMHEIADHMSAGHACIEWVSSEVSMPRLESSAIMS